ncbi:MAG: sigma-70 family RNA polymerase sigma factor [Egibacteraceae bacterium]
MVNGSPRAPGPPARSPRVGARSGSNRRRSRRYGSFLDLYFDQVGIVDLLTADEEVALAQTMDVGRDAAVQLAAGAPDDGGRLDHAVAAGRRARERFIAANLRLVVHVAWRHPGAAGIDLADLIQDGNVGLIEAVDRFDWRRGYRFSTYAAWWIRQSIQRGTASANRAIRLPYPLHEAVLRTTAARERLQAVTGLDPSPRELALATRLDVRMVQRALRIPPDALSLHRPINGEDHGADFGDLVAVATDCPADEVSDRLACATALDAARTLLDERSRLVLALRFGLDGGEPLSYETIGAQVGLSRESIRLIVKRALAVLRVALGEGDPDETCRPRLPRIATQA